MTDIYYLYSKRSNDEFIENTKDWKAFLKDQYDKWTGPGCFIQDQYERSIAFALEHALRILVTRTKKGTIGSPMFFIYAEFNETDGLVYKMLSDQDTIVDHEFLDSCINIR